MKVNGHDHPEAARSTPALNEFQRVFQGAGTPRASQLPPTAPRPAVLPGRGQFPPQLPAYPRGGTPPPKSSLPLPMGPSRGPGTAFASGPVLATARSAIASPENLGLARQTMHHEADRLKSVRTEAQTTGQEKTEHRLSELISRELTREVSAGASLELSAPAHPKASREVTPVEGLPSMNEARSTPHAASLALPEPSNPQVKVQATLQLIEKIELFVQSQRPALRMSLGQPLPATVEVERTGPREVALRIQGRHGPLAQEDLTRIRDALGARGLKLRSLRAE